MEDAIIVQNLFKRYLLFDKDYKIVKWLFTGKGYTNEKFVLNDISFTVKAGEVIGVIGKNGAGKSTLMQLVAGITLPTSGKIIVKGTVGALVNLSAGFNPEYTGRKNLYYKGALMGMTKKEIDHLILPIQEFVELGDYFDMPLRMYSSGMAARLGFGLAVFTNPNILIIDEVFAVGDRKFQRKSKEKIRELFTSGKSILFSSHSEELIREFCSKVLYLKDGKIAHFGDIDTGFQLYNQDLLKH